jgi:hypothetical protein
MCTLTPAHWSSAAKRLRLRPRERSLRCAEGWHPRSRGRGAGSREPFADRGRPRWRSTPRAGTRRASRDASDPRVPFPGTAASRSGGAPRTSLSPPTSVGRPRVACVGGSLRSRGPFRHALAARPATALRTLLTGKCALQRANPRLNARAETTKGQASPSRDPVSFMTSDGL